MVFKLLSKASQPVRKVFGTTGSRLFLEIFEKPDELLGFESAGRITKDAPGLDGQRPDGSGQLNSISKRTVITSHSRTP
jgi:hypothetical protein